MEPRLGEFEQLVLLALVRLGDDAYGVTVHEEIVRRTGRVTTFGTVYATLSRLEEKGLVRSHLGEPTATRGGRRKKHFAVSPAGARALRATLRGLRTMTRGLDSSWQLP